MATNFSKKTIQNAGIVKKSKFDLTHDFSTSFNWGEVQPLMCRLLPTATTNDIKLSTLIRLSSMNVPTFGRVAFKQSWHFVPMADIFPNYKNVLSGVPQAQITASDDTTLLTTKFPTITPQTLMWKLLTKGNAMFDRFTRDGENVVANEWNYTNSAPTVTNITGLFPGLVSSSGLFRLEDFSDYSRTKLVNTYGFSSDAMNELIYPTGADFSAIYTAFSFGTNTDNLFTFRLSTKGRRLYKILLSLGYVVDFEDKTEVSLLPLMAFYKAYFDAYSLPQYDNWEMTACYKLIKYFNTYGSVSFNIAATSGSSQESRLLDKFFEDLEECWYTENMDYVSAHIQNAGSMPGGTEQNESQLRYSVNGTFESAATHFVGSDTTAITVNGFGFPGYIAGKVFDQVSDDVLKKMYIAINRDSAIGYQIKERLIARGYKTYVDECKSNFLKAMTTPIQISDVNSTSDTLMDDGSGRPLGDVAGKGLQYDESDNLHFENSEIGYLIGIGCIAPINSGYPFSLDPTLLGVNRYTFYNPEYDSLSYEQTPKMCIGHSKAYYVPGDTTNQESKVFGVIPRYSGYKIANNRLSGSFAFNSERKSWMPYTLDRDIIENNDAEFTLNDTTSTKFRWTAVTNGISHIPIAGKEWRYPTNNSWKGNYNRIFLNEGMMNDGNPVSPFFTHTSDESYLPTSDNFLFHSVIQHDQWANMLPISESFDTIDEDKNAPTLDIKD